MAYSDEVLSLSPVLYWEIEPEQPAANDLSGNNNDGAFSGSVISGDFLYVNGETLGIAGGTAVTSPDISAALASGGFSVSLVSKCETSSQGYVLFSIASASGPEWFGFYPGGRGWSNTKILTVNGSVHFGSSGTLSPDQFFDHFVVTVDAAAGQVTVYQNGVQAIQEAVTIGSVPADARLVVHDDPHSPDMPYRRPSGEVALFDGVLTSTQVADLYSAMTREPAHVGDIFSLEVVDIYPMPAETLTTSLVVLKDPPSVYGDELDQKANATISGTVTDEDGGPVERMVRAFDRRYGRLVAETWSDEAGSYRFDKLDPARYYTILAYDHTGEHNAVVADWAKPEVPA